MASKKYILVVALIVLLQSVGMAQTDWGWDWKDTSKISVKNLPQHNEFLNNQYPYPAKPRSQWELGLSVGNSRIFGEIANYGFGYGLGVSLRKAISHVFSFRGGITYTESKGISTALWTGAPTDGWLSPQLPYKGFTTYEEYLPYKSTAADPYQAVAPNYRNKSISGNFDLIASLASLSHYRGNPKWDVYVFMGYAIVSSDVDTRLALGGNSAQSFDFTSINFNQPAKDVQKAVNNLLSQAPASGASGNWTNAPVRYRRDDAASGQALLHHALTYGLGASYKLSDKVNIGLEERVTNAFNGDLDGFNTGFDDNMNYFSAHVNINLGNKAKRVQPLYWLNPNNYVYSELNVPRHMKLPKTVLPDTDGDGVTDQFDLEPNTPKGAPVDSHGVSKDTDGDGVPDFKDKEILTSLKCFPVNADGVGTCPEPACCKEIRDMMQNQMAQQNNKPNCTIGSLPSVQFAKNSAKLSKSAESVLASAAATIQANPNCNVRVVGYGASSKAAQQLSWERVNAVIKYLTEKQGISESRLLFQYGQDGDANTVDLQGTSDSGPNTVPAPHPNLKSKG